MLPLSALIKQPWCQSCSFVRYPFLWWLDRWPILLPVPKAELELAALRLPISCCTNLTIGGITQVITDYYYGIDSILDTTPNAYQ